MVWLACGMQMQWLRLLIGGKVLAKKLSTTLLVMFATLLTYTMTAHSIQDQPDTKVCRVPDALIMELTDWIEENTKYDVQTLRNVIPKIEFCKTGDEINYLEEHIIVEAHTEPLYDFKKRTITLVGEWNPENERDVGNLLHELIHAVQFDNRQWDCIGQPEWETYKLHEKWLNEHAIEAEFDWLLIYMTSRCPRDIHPD